MRSRGLEFVPVGLRDYNWIYRYTSQFGEGSCQHSPVSMFSLAHKYGDSVCERDGILYTLRSLLCDESCRVYLAPLGPDAAKGYATILRDAEACGKKARFVSLTQTHAALLEEAFPGRFDIQENRDLTEYLFSSQVMATFSGHSLQRKRGEIHAFWGTWEKRASVYAMSPDDAQDVLAFEHAWLEQAIRVENDAALTCESQMIGLQMAHFDELHLCGIVLRIDGDVRGFGYGTRLSDTVFDAIVEKGDRTLPHVYKVLRQELARQCASDCDYMNIEEDLGVPGLRQMKLAYHPDLLLSKYIATEK